MQMVDGPAVMAGRPQHGKEHPFVCALLLPAMRIDTKQDLWFSTKDTISKIYDGRVQEGL